MNSISIVSKEVGHGFFSILGANVRALRIKKKLTQEQLANLCDLHRTYIGAIERGDRNVSLKNIVIIAQALNVKLASNLLPSDPSLDCLLFLPNIFLMYIPFPVKACIYNKSDYLSPSYMPLFRHSSSKYLYTFFNFRLTYLNYL